VTSETGAILRLKIVINKRVEFSARKRLKNLSECMTQVENRGVMRREQVLEERNRLIIPYRVNRPQSFLNERISMYIVLKTKL